MASIELKTKEDIEKIIGMVLFDRQDPLEASYENEDEEQADAAPESEQEELYRKRCGHVLAQLGDEFLKEKSKGQPEPLQASLVESVKSALGEDQAWERFKEVIDNATEGNVVRDSYKTLGSLILALHGLRSLGEGAKKLAATLANRYVSEANLDRDIARIGGLTKLMTENLD